MPTLYHAFISYSHAADGQLAPALQTALQRFAKPWYRLRALHLFRDQTSLSATPGLWPAIEATLPADRSRGAGARSPWVVKVAARTRVHGGDEHKSITIDPCQHPLP